MTTPRILVCRGGALGDFLLTLPALQALRARWPHAHVEVACYPRVACLALAGGLADAVLSLDRADVAEWFTPTASLPVAQQQELGSFDVIISYLHDPEGAVLETFRRAGAKRVIAQSPLVTAGHAIDQFMQPLGALGLRPSGREFARLPVPAEWKAASRQRVGPLGERVLAIHPGSGSPKKNWPLARFMELAEGVCRSSRHMPVFLLGEVEQGMAVELQATGSRWPVLAGLDLRDVAGVLSECSGYVGNDSGITHLAAAVGTPTVAIFGPTDPRVWAPRGPNVKIVQAGPRLDKVDAETVLAALTRCVE